MPATNPGARRRFVAAELRRLRQEAGLSGDEVADRLGWSASKVSRIETHSGGLRLSDLRRLLDLYQVREPDRQRLLDLGAESSGASQRGGGDIAADEAEASIVLEWAATIVPRLLRTRDYAMALARSTQGIYLTPPGALERAVDASLAWQCRLTEQAPLVLRAVLDESVLQRRVGIGVMRAQLEHLAEVSARPNVEVRVVRLGGPHPTGVGSFTYLEFGQVHGVALPDAVVCEHLGHSCRLDAERETYPYRLAFDQLWSVAPAAPESARMITRAASRWDHKRSRNTDYMDTGGARGALLNRTPRGARAHASQDLDRSRRSPRRGEGGGVSA